MNHEISPHFFLSDEIYEALGAQLPVVALESTVITHGLPYPKNLDLAKEMEAEVRAQGAVPATIAIVDGKIRVGVNAQEIKKLAQASDMIKISTRDIASALALRLSGGTTVAATMFIAFTAGIRVFATGGIGGVHPQSQNEFGRLDVSADLPQLSKTPMVVVCAGAKAILDLPATVEYLETWGVPVVGYRSSEFPGFYTIETGLKTSSRAETPADVVKISELHWQLGLDSAVLVVNSPPAEAAMPPLRVEAAVAQALQEASDRQIQGQQVTPFLLARVSELTGGESLQANLALLRNNARLAAQIAVSLVKS